MKKLIALLLLLTASRAWATNGYIQSTSCHGNGGATNCAFNSNVTAGNTIIVGCTANTDSSLNITTDTKSNSYTFVSSTYQTTAGSGLYYVSYALNATAGATTVTCSGTGAQPIDMSISEYASTVTAGGFDVYSASNPASTALTAASSGNATTSAANDLMYEFCALIGGSSASGANGTIRENYTFDYTQFTQDAIVATPSSYASTAVITSGNHFGCIQAGFLQNAAAQTGTFTLY